MRPREPSLSAPQLRSAADRTAAAAAAWSLSAWRDRPDRATAMEMARARLRRRSHVSRSCSPARSSPREARTGISAPLSWRARSRIASIRAGRSAGTDRGVGSIRGHSCGATGRRGDGAPTGQRRGSDPNAQPGQGRLSTGWHLRKAAERAPRPGRRLSHPSVPACAVHCAALLAGRSASLESSGWDRSAATISALLRAVHQHSKVLVVDGAVPTPSLRVECPRASPGASCASRGGNVRWRSAAPPRGGGARIASAGLRARGAAGQRCGRMRSVSPRRTGRRGPTSGSPETGPLSDIR